MSETALYILLAWLALVIYEFIITFEHEVAIVWRRKLSMTSILLAVIRWSMVVNAVLQNIGVATDKVSLVFLIPCNNH